VQLEEGTTYTVDISDSLSRSAISITDREAEVLARNTEPTGDRVSRFAWTAPKSDTYFVMVIGSYTNSYTLTVTGGGTATSSAQSPTTTPGTSPASLASGTALNFASVSTGGNHTCGVTPSGVAYCWAWDFNGQLGNGPATDDQPNPVAVSDGLTLAMVSAGSGHTCGITTVGAAYCWGTGDGGRLGNGSTDGQITPVAVSGGLVFASVNAGINHSCGATTAGAAYCWGLGDDRIGSDSINQRMTPVQTRPVAVSGGLKFESVSAGSGHTCGVTTSNTAYCWGAGNSGRLGDGLEKNQSTPVAVVSPAGG
jgi:alpha-tubulin suppressor-like RCC1 family protein